jgi:leucyl aminopeptidase (aminopeptidase T)
MRSKDRRGNAMHCIVDTPGWFSTVPTIEANTSIIEGSANGIIVVDASVPYLGIGVLRDLIRMKVENGFITDIEGGHQARILKEDLKSKNDPNVYNIAELGVGLNPMSELTGIMLDDEGVLGTCHIGIGTSLALGGKLKAAVHYDLVLWKPTIELDGKIVIEEGKLKFSP